MCAIWVLLLTSYLFFFFQWAYNDFCRIAPSAKAPSELIITMKKSKLQRNERAKCIILCRVKILQVIKFQGKRVQTLLKFILLKFPHASQALICVVFSFTWIFSKVHVWLILLWKWKWMFLVYVLVKFSLKTCLQEVLHVYIAKISTILNATLFSTTEKVNL